MAGGNKHGQKKLKKIVKNKQTVRRRAWKLKENNMKARFQEKVKEPVDVDASNIRNDLKIVFQKLLMKYVERRNVREIMGTRGGGMKK